MLRAFRQSLITRLMIYFIVTGFLLTLVFGINLFHNIRVQFQQEVLPNIAQYLEYVVEDIGTPPDLEKARLLSARLSIGLRIHGPGINWKSHDRIPEIDDISFKTAPTPYQQFKIERKRGRNYALLQKGDYRYMYVIGRPFRNALKDPVHRDHRHDRSLVVIGFMVATLLILFLLIRRSLKPMKALEQGIQRIGQGDLDAPIDPPGSTEFRQLAQGINDMAEQIKSMLEGKRELLLAISHELRSPITRAKVNLALMPDSEIKQALMDDCQEMELLIEKILESERLNQKHAVLHKTRFDLASVIHEVIDQYFYPIEIQFESHSLQVMADRSRLTLLIKNLLDNAVKYSSDTDQNPEVAITTLNDQIQITVQDHGQGMAAEELEKITDAFYRVDPARTRNTGGVGLGLYLCRLVVEAHDGTINFTSEPGQGTMVTITLPELEA